MTLELVHTPDEEDDREQEIRDVNDRVIFMRHYWFSDSYREIVGIVGLSEKNISVRLTRIREKLKQYLIEREVFV